jgi:peptidyl-prolyl cis-trans isomerase D
MERYFFEDFRVKVSNVEKSGQGTSTEAANRVWEQGFCASHN